jgi:anti-sigma factor RsiW
MRFLRRTPAREEELAALADGSLAPERHAEVEAMIRRSPELMERLVEQRNAVELLRSAADVEAPAALRARVQPSPSRPARARERRRSVWIGAAAAGVAVVALGVVLALPSNVPGGPSVADAAVLATRPATAGPPAAASPTLLARSVDDVPFPNWAKKFGWEPAGARVDRVGGRDTTTVFYEKAGKRLAYTIVGGDALRNPKHATVAHREGVELRFLTVDGRRVVTWQRDGHTCVLSGGVPRATLAKLAAWNGKGTVPF